MASQFSNCVFNLYKKSLFTVVPVTAVIGFGSGLSDIVCDEEKQPAIFKFSTVIAYTTLGLLTGLTYPITFPVITREKFRY